MLTFFLSSCSLLQAQVSGCTDVSANNYNKLATENDGSCTYNNVTIKPTFNNNLDKIVDETSGLLYWNKQVWTHNDSGGQPDLYVVNDSTGKVIKTVTITNATNVDWEDLAQDNKYVYIGDCGNNEKGNRTNLRIYKIKKADLKIKTTVTAAVINFSYNDQTAFTPERTNHTDFDCEAIIAYGDSLYLFSKDWIDHKTRLYKLPKTPGKYSAINIGDLNVDGLITGAEIVAGKKVIVLTGYTNSVTPFIYLLYDFNGNKFFSANKRKIELNETLTQIEGICSITDTKFYLSNEKFKIVLFTPAKLQTLDLGSLLKPYYKTLSAKKTASTNHTKN